MTIRSKIVSCGAYLPKRVLTNFDLEKMVDTSDEWIVQRSGIRERRIAAENEKTSDLAIAAADEAMRNAGLTGGDIDGIIVCTSTPDNTFPSVAVSVQAALDIGNGFAFDLQAVCAGFVYGLAVADNFIRAGQARRVLLIGAEKFSSLLDWTDRTTCVLFGDGAAAVILEACEGLGDQTDQGILSTHLHANGKLKDILYTDGGPATTGTSGKIKMDGKEVFRHAVRYMADVVDEVLEANGIAADRIDWLVPHQANIRIIEGTAKKLGIPMERVLVTLDRQGNTSAASIPLALTDAVNSGKIMRGDLLLIEGLGGGITWGAALVRY
ncbi:MAG: ketoacyl-ACP synthase III [Alphaproteobacteria bacterium]|nr:ketoacyl-ACP synthase III [Alphaproteobacteria bacterium]